MAAPLELSVAAFDDAARAEKALADRRALERAGDIALVNAALLDRDSEGRAHPRETQDVRAPGGALFGAVVGGGLLGGPAGAARMSPLFFLAGPIRRCCPARPYAV